MWGLAGLLSENQVTRALAAARRLDKKEDGMEHSNMSDSYSGSDFNSDLESVLDEDEAKQCVYYAVTAVDVHFVRLIFK